MAKILIVDDSIVMRKNLTTILTQGGHQVIGEASNGKQAVSQYVDLEPDIVTMDISMPILSGVEAVKQIIQIDAEAKIVMISAVNQKKMVFSAINNGAKHYIVKPIDPKKLLSIIHEVICGNVEEIAEEENETLSTQQGFVVENLEGTFIITFNKFLDSKDHSLLSMAIRGLMFINPLRVTFNFGDLEHISDALLEPILRLSDEVKNANGVMTLVTTSQSIEKKLNNWK